MQPRQQSRAASYSREKILRRTAYTPVRLQRVDESNEEAMVGQCKVSCTNWCIFDANCQQTFGVREEQQRQIASLTKIMTTILSLELFQRYGMDRGILIRISHGAATQTGTSANLRESKYIQVYDLLYGAMLPSGNDAAYLLAQIFGLLLFYESVKPQCKDYSEIESIDLTCYDTTQTFISRFIKQMNSKAKQLRMHRTSFSNPHGLANVLNISSAKDVITLCKYACSNLQFKQIMSSRQHVALLYEPDMSTVNVTRTWVNTNKLLDRGWEGVKTGHTGSAGGCLASLRDGVYVVVLNCSSRDARFDDTLTLHEWHMATYYDAR